MLKRILTVFRNHKARREKAMMLRCIGNHDFMETLLEIFEPRVRSYVIGRIDYSMLDYEEVASHISTSDVAEDVAYHICTSDVAYHMEAGDVASYMDCHEVAGYIDTDDLDMSEIASNICQETLAGYVGITAQDVADEIDINEITEEFKMKMEDEIFTSLESMKSELVSEVIDEIQVRLDS